jgi:hypothetical protein
VMALKIIPGVAIMARLSGNIGNAEPHTQAPAVSTCGGVRSN